MLEWLVLLTAGFVGGVLNAIAGGGSFIIYPILLSLGVAPVSANASTSLIVLPGQASSALGYRRYIRKLPKSYYLLLIPCCLGAILGAVLLARTPDAAFECIVPWFIIGATVLFGLQGRVHHWLYGARQRRLRQKYGAGIIVLLLVAMFGLSVYGGYFGAGFGIMMLAFLGLTKLTNIHQMNGLKNIIGTILTTVVASYFAMEGLIAWHVLPLLIIGNVAGGWIGATYSEKLPVSLIRGFIVVVGLILAAVLFIRAY